MKKRTGNCYVCGKENVTIAKKLYDGSLCIKCNNKRLLAKKEPKKPTGKWATFIEIWNTRPHVSEVSGEPLGNVMKPIFFSHLLPASYPYYATNPDNIILKTAQEHHDWQFTSRIDLVKKDPRWQKILDKYEMLKEKYFEEFGN
jgi:hypothetical protein